MDVVAVVVTDAVVHALQVVDQDPAHDVARGLVPAQGHAALHAVGPSHAADPSPKMDQNHRRNLAPALTHVQTNHASVTRNPSPDPALKSAIVASPALVPAPSRSDALAVALNLRIISLILVPGLIRALDLDPGIALTLRIRGTSLAQPHPKITITRLSAMKVWKIKRLVALILTKVQHFIHGYTLMDTRITNLTLMRSMFVFTKNGSHSFGGGGYRTTIIRNSILLVYASHTHSFKK